MNYLFYHIKKWVLSLLFGTMMVVMLECYDQSYRLQAFKIFNGKHKSKFPVDCVNCASIPSRITRTSAGRLSYTNFLHFTIFTILAPLNHVKINCTCFCIFWPKIYTEKKAKLRQILSEPGKTSKRSRIIGSQSVMKHVDHAFIHIHCSLCEQGGFVGHLDWKMRKRMAHCEEEERGRKIRGKTRRSHSQTFERGEGHFLLF